MFYLVKNNSFQCIWRALDFEITYEIWGHETLNCQQKKSHYKYKVQTQSLQWYPKHAWDLWITYHCPCQKTNKKKRLKSYLQPLVKIGKTMQQPLHASKMKKIEKLQPLHKLKETLLKCSLCLPKCKLKNYVITFAHLLNCTCYAFTST